MTSPALPIKPQEDCKRFTNFSTTELAYKTAQPRANRSKEHSLAALKLFNGLRQVTALLLRLGDYVDRARARPRRTRNRLTWTLNKSERLG